jgi:hypothetical protein
MFRQLAREYAKPETAPESEFPRPQADSKVQPNASSDQSDRFSKFLELFLYHPIQLAGLLEAAWEARFRAQVDGGQYVSPITGLPEPLLHQLTIVSARPYDAVPDTSLFKLSQKVRFDHLIYAYMIENTRIYEIFRRVLYEFLHGERLEVPSPESQRWLRNTEELFYRDTPPFLAFQLTSYIRPDIRASRRNAYYRMFGMDVDFGTDDGRPYPYEKPAAANRDFVGTLEEFLREVWRAIINVRNISGPNTTDDQAIADRAERLSDMLNVRRRNGNLSREEFFFVATMSWFHLTVEANAPIVKDLKAEATSPADTLRKIGERVGLPPHAKSQDFFSLAEPMSRLLIAIESGTFNDAKNVRPLYLPGSPLRNDIEKVIASWSAATGRTIKELPVTPSPAWTPPPIASPARVLPAATSPVTTNSAAVPVPAPRP